MRVDKRLCDHCGNQVRPKDAFGFIPLDPERGQGDRFDFCTIEHLLAWLDAHPTRGYLA